MIRLFSIASRASSPTDSQLRVTLVGFSIYRMGGGGTPAGFSPAQAIAGLKANPMQAVMAAMMLSNMLF